MHSCKDNWVETLIVDIVMFQVENKIEFEGGQSAIDQSIEATSSCRRPKRRKTRSFVRSNNVCLPGAKSVDTEHGPAGRAQYSELVHNRAETRSNGKDRPIRSRDGVDFGF